MRIRTLAPLLALLLAAGAAAAEEPAWSGSSISYGHVMAARSVSKDAEPGYNPYYAHALSLQPRWKLGEGFTSSATLSVEQELTNSDWTTTEREALLGDLLLDLDWAGLEEPTSGVRFSAGLRTGLPTSKASQAATQLVYLAPGAGLTRRFGPVDVSYRGRWTQRFHEATTVQYDAPTIADCGDPASCGRFLDSGIRNTVWDLSHGPAIAYRPIDSLSVSTALQLYVSRLYDAADGPLEGPTGPVVPGGAEDPESTFHSTYFTLAARWQALKPLGLTLDVTTFAPQLGPDGRRQNPFFNRATTVGLALDVDLQSTLTLL